MWISQRFGKSLKTFGLQIYFLRFFKSIGWYGFSYGVLVVLNFFINFLLKVITYLKFYNHCFIKEDLRKHICLIRWCLVRQRNPYARPYGCENLYTSKKPAIVTLQLTKSKYFRQNHLRKHAHWPKGR